MLLQLTGVAGGLLPTMCRYLFPVLLLVLSLPATAECRDRDAIAAGEEHARSYFKKADVFHPGRVLKVHHPSRHKEVAAYVQTGDKRYSIFTLVDENCRARFIKRTRQGD